MIPVVEIFGDTIQGEGALIGCPAVFVRTFGCNLNCRGFGMPAGQLSDEADRIMDDPVNMNAKSIKDLPLAKTGCDSYPAVHPLCARFAKRYSPIALARDIYKLANSQPRLVVFTGGEPMIHQQEINQVIEHLKELGFKKFMFETNGTIPYNGCDALKDSEKPIEITFSVSPKLSNSGNPSERAYNSAAIKTYTQYGTTYLKYVVSSPSEMPEVIKWTNGIRACCEQELEVFLMPEGGVLDERSQRNAKMVAELCWQYNYRFSPREHLTVFGNAWGK